MKILNETLMIMPEPVSITPDWPVPAHVKVVSTTRTGGFSLSPFDSFNLALHTADDESRVAKNRKLLREYFHLPAEPVWLNQVHGAKVISLDDSAADTSVLIDADASFTTQPNKVCAVMTADCLPVFITDIKGSVVAIAHAGWKGLLAGVITATLNRLDIDHRDILVWLGPAIGPDAFVVGDEVRALFAAKGGEYESAFTAGSDAGSWYCDIYQLARSELANLGVGQVYGGDQCTYGDEEKFYSYRRDGELTGRQAHCIWMSQP